jgi:hypothetical protein
MNAWAMLPLSEVWRTADRGPPLDVCMFDRLVISSLNQTLDTEPKLPIEHHLLAYATWRLLAS